MFQAGADKDNVKSQTGHRRDGGVMAYREFSKHEKLSFQMMLEKRGVPLFKKIDDSLMQGDGKFIFSSSKTTDGQIYNEMKTETSQ